MGARVRVKGGEDARESETRERGGGSRARARGGTKNRADVETMETTGGGRRSAG